MSDFSLEQMKLALAYHMVVETIDADLEVNDAEERFLSRTFPADSLRKAGFVDNTGTTVRFEQCLGQALITLPETMSLADRLAILTQVFQASLADEEFARQEGAVLVKASRLLAITPSQLDDHLDALESVGNVDLPAPE